MDKEVKKVNDLNDLDDLDALKEQLQSILVDLIAAEHDPELQRQLIDQLKKT